MRNQRGVKLPEIREFDVESARPALREALLRREAEGDRPGLAHFDNRMSRRIERRVA